jgi:hypothetical protein
MHHIGPARYKATCKVDCNSRARLILTSMCRHTFHNIPQYIDRFLSADTRLRSSARDDVL